jgi:hypothetical protein
MHFNVFCQAAKAVFAARRGKCMKEFRVKSRTAYSAPYDARFDREPGNFQ